MNSFLAHAYRLLNHGPTTLVSAKHAGRVNVMAASWVCALDMDPPKLTAVLDKSTQTRELIEASGWMLVQIPTVAQIQQVQYVGTHSGHDSPHKAEDAGLEWLEVPDCPLPMVAGCSAWLLCKILPQPENETSLDLFLAEVTAAWSDTRVFREGRWHFESADPSWRSLHHVAGGNFYAIGEALQAATAAKL